MSLTTTILLWPVYFLSLYFAIFWLLVFLTHYEAKTEKGLSTVPFVTITIPAYNEEQSISRTLTSVLQLDYPKERYEVIVVDDGSTDNTAPVVYTYIQQHPEANIQLIQQQNKGKGASLNTALKQAKGEFFVCLDADSFVQPNALKKLLLQFAEQNVAAVLPALKVHEPKEIIEKIQWYEYIINMFYKELMSKLNCIHVTPGPFSIYRTSTLKEVGYFDEQNITEDLEIALRLQSHQYRLIQIMDTTVTTLAPRTIKKLYQQRNRWFKGATLNALKYRKLLFNKKYGDFGFIQMPTIILSGLIAIVLVCTALYYGLKPSLEYVSYLHSINFDFIPLLLHFDLNFSIMDLNYITLFIGLIMLVITLYILKQSEVRTDEKMLKYGFFSISIYLLFYFLFLGLVWMGVFYDIITRKKQQW